MNKRTKWWYAWRVIAGLVNRNDRPQSLRAGLQHRHRRRTRYLHSDWQRPCDYHRQTRRHRPRRPTFQRLGRECQAAALRSGHQACAGSKVMFTKHLLDLAPTDRERRRHHPAVARHPAAIRRGNLLSSRRRFTAELDSRNQKANRSTSAPSAAAPHFRPPRWYQLMFGEQPAAPTNLPNEQALIKLTEDGKGVVAIGWRTAHPATFRHETGS